MDYTFICPGLAHFYDSTVLLHRTIIEVQLKEGFVMRVKTLFGSALAAVLVVATLPVSALAADSSALYDAVPANLPPNVASVGFQATSTFELGDHVVLKYAGSKASTVTVTMSDWALYSQYTGDNRYSGNPTSWTHPITLNIYGTELVNGVPSNKLATKTITATIPWRPAADPTCNGGTAWRASDSNCYNGYAFNLSFDLSDLNVVLPKEVILGVSYNTGSYGLSPIGEDGPYNSLNVGVPSNQNATVGSDFNTDSLFWNTSYAPFYADGGTAGVNTFREDTSWSPNGTVAFRINSGDFKDECKNDGWKTIPNPENGNAFKNQGQCVSFFAKNQKNTTFSNYTLDSAKPSGTNVPTSSKTLYKVTVSGTWINNRSPADQVDTSYVSQNNWLSYTNGPVVGYADSLLEVQLNRNFVNWGSYNSGHTYSYWVVGTGSNLNLSVFDGENNFQNPGWYGDNVGNLNVSVAAFKL